MPSSQQPHTPSPDEFGSPVPDAELQPVAPLKMSFNRWVPTKKRFDIYVLSLGQLPSRKIPAYLYHEMVQHKVMALLNKITIASFDSISDQIIRWENKSVNENDGRTLFQVIRLVFEKATDEALWSELYARLCRKMMEQISLKVHDDRSKNSEGKPMAGGQLFRKYLLDHCQKDFERGWFAKEATTATAKAYDDQTTKAANEKKNTDEVELYSVEYYAAQKAKRQGLGLIKFIGELFKVRMLTERIMHECVKKFFRNVENPEEEEIESLCQLLKTVGQLLDTPKARAHMDVYFAQMKELGKKDNVSSRMQFMLQDVIELRDRKWVSRNVVVARVGERNPEFGWVAGGLVLRPLPKAGDLSQFGTISKGAGAPMVFLGRSSVFVGGKRDSKREPLSRTNPSFNIENPELTPETSTTPSCPRSREPSVDLGRTGAPEPAPMRKMLQLLPRSKPAAKENVTTLSEDEPTAMPEADAKKKIDGDVKEFFAVRDLREADVYFTDLPREHRFRLVDKLVVSALQRNKSDARLVGNFFARAASNGQCAPENFEEGFMSMAEFLDDIAVDVPKALEYIAIMLGGAGFDTEPQRLQRVVLKFEDKVSKLF